MLKLLKVGAVKGWNGGGSKRLMGLNLLGGGTIERWNS